MYVIHFFFFIVSFFFFLFYHSSCFFFFFVTVVMQTDGSVCSGVFRGKLVLVTLFHIVFFFFIIIMLLFPVVYVYLFLCHFCLFLCFVELK